jgi:hypothetical protein
MAYIINKYNGTVQTTVDDGTVNTSTELKFIGKNYAGYGEAQNENFMFLLENFAGSSAPPKPVSGMIWFDTSVSKLKVYDGTKWKTTGGTEISATQPSGFVEGEFWWNNSTEQLYVKNSLNEWILVGPQTAPGVGETQMKSITLTDTGAASHNVITGTINDTVVFVISKDADFTNSTGTAITGFDVIKQGVTLIDTRASTAGVTSSNYRFWGTASNAVKLNGRAASDYLTTDNTSFASVVSFDDSGITLGSDNDLIINIDTDLQTPVIKLVRNLLRIKNASNSLISYIDSTGIHPGATNTFDLGKSSEKWQTVYATTFNGIATQADTLKVGSSYKTASVSATADTVASRTAANETIGGQTITAGALKATFFVGTATVAQYADLAEKYTVEFSHPVGTAMAVSYNGEHETCPANSSNVCIGVISEKPAYLMNSHIDGQAIALKGRVPVRITGPVKKGQAVYAWQDGVCSTLATNGLVGVALETNESNEEKLVECVLKV